MESDGGGGVDRDEDLKVELTGENEVFENTHTLTQKKKGNPPSLCHHHHPCQKVKY